MHLTVPNMPAHFWGDRLDLYSRPSILIPTCYDEMWFCSTNGLQPTMNSIEAKWLPWRKLKKQGLLCYSVNSIILDRSPTNPKSVITKRIIALQGDTVKPLRSDIKGKMDIERSGITDLMCFIVLCRSPSTQRTLLGRRRWSIPFYRQQLIWHGM